MKSPLVMQGSCEKSQKSPKNYENLLDLLRKFKNLLFYDHKYFFICGF